MVKKTDKKEVKADHWSQRRSKEVDRTKRSCNEPTKIDESNIISTPRPRKNIDYKAVQLKGEIKMVKRNTSNTYDKRSTTKIEKKKPKRTTTKKKEEKKEEKKTENE
ncbi:hypothetical protein FDP41_012320 [Naegleria fowleri]|uniref:Uncharacterized protein n=1 Tax=Naegleria fowleri TaxID=5763 RepID=A0A6A5BU74_NAEFO|nr:uncharacterized protein FDP41_012320 [Naegleria fowleri]KAF0981663.1 hypothetical protein FDP41_012320 [Naegleria fowleri]CAG4719228.1 unnamed protein product [Naegleria fowleri]